MSRYPANKHGILISLGFIVLLAVLGCKRLPAQTAGPTPTPLPLPDDRAMYLMLTDKYTSYYAIVGIEQMPADEAARILRALRDITPPIGLEGLHEQAVHAYEQICTGKLLLPGADSTLRAEAYFLIDWGVGRLLDYRQQLDELQQEDIGARDQDLGDQR